MRFALAPDGIRARDPGTRGSRSTPSRSANRRARAPSPDAIEVFTTRIDTIYGANFLLLAPEHPLVQEWSKEPGAGELSPTRSSGSRRRIARRG